MFGHFPVINTVVLVQCHCITVITGNMCANNFPPLYSCLCFLFNTVYLCTWLVMSLLFLAVENLKIERTHSHIFNGS